MKNDKIAFYTDGGVINETYDRFQNVLSGIQNPKQLRIIEESFRVSGYGRVREKLKEISKIQILIGIDTSDIYRKHTANLFLFGSDKTEAHAKAIYTQEFINDFAKSDYYSELEQSAELLCQDIANGKTEIRIHTTNEMRTNLFLINYNDPMQYGEQHWGIVGNGSLSRTTKGAPRFALCNEISDYDTTKFVKDEFDKIWKQGLPITLSDIHAFKAKTHMGQTPTPYELYMKVLIDYFGSQVENSYTLRMPDGFKKLKYQVDAVLQGFEMLIRHNGFILADVVGLGKTVIAAMTARHFVELNGVAKTKILVVYPPNNSDNWEYTFEKFGLTRYTQFVSLFALDKMLAPNSDYWDKEEYDLVFVDEAHKARNNGTIMFDALQRICKSGRRNIGNVKGTRKMVVPVTATPLNNSPEDIYNILTLFQDFRNSTISGVANLKKYFTPKIAQYKELMRERSDVSAEEQKSLVEQINEIYEPIRREVLDQVTVRRTRDNLMKNAVYKEDLQRQGIVFPIVERPTNINYYLDGEVRDLFGETMFILTEKVKYARYKAIERFTQEHRHKYPRAGEISRALGVLYRTHMVKRLESSFFAFRKSLKRLTENTELMIEMFDNDEVIIAPDMKIKVLVDQGWTLDEIIEGGLSKFGFSDRSEFVYPASAFDPDFVVELREDAAMLRKLYEDWEKIEGDPKLDEFVKQLQEKLFDPKINPTGKLVVFSESAETVTYLCENLNRLLNRSDILAISSKDRARLQDTVLANFDANYDGEQKNDFNILITTDTLAESVNLHRANIVLHYDTPWNAIRLMQRNGRVNRIGTVAESILNFLFYPSAEGNAQISLYQNALAKLQGFHSAFGEDAQIFSAEEIVKVFELFNPRIGDDEDRRGVYLYELQEFFNDNPEDYERIKNLPIKSRAQRQAENLADHTSLVYICSEYKYGYYIVDKTGARELPFLDAADLLRATKDDKALDKPFEHEHYKQVSAAYKKYESEITVQANNTVGITEKDPKSSEAAKYVRTVWRSTDDGSTKEKLDRLSEYIEQGVYSKLTRDVNSLKNKKPEIDLAVQKLIELYDKYYTDREEDSEFVEQNFGVPTIVLSVSFIKV